MTQQEDLIEDHQLRKMAATKEAPRDDINVLLDEVQVKPHRDARPDDFGIGDINSTAKGSGARRNTGKISLSLVPLHLLAGVARVLMGGKLKYAEWNWAKGMDWHICFDCAQRHLQKWWYFREELDVESGEHHLDHAICNLLFLRHYVSAYKDGDNRPPTFANFRESLDDFNQKFDEEDFKRRTGYAPKGNN